MAMRNMMNTITLITIRNTPQTISLMMYQRILTIQRKQRNRNANTASPMDCAVCLMFIAAVILGVVCQVLLFCQFFRTISCGVPSYSLVFSPLSVLAYKEYPQYVGEVKPPSLQWYRTFEIGIAVYLFGYPILFLSVQHLAIIHFHTKSVNLALMQAFQCRNFPLHEFCCYCCFHIHLFLFLMRIRELRELSFQPYMPPVYPTFFLMRLSVASVVFVSGASKKVGSGQSKGFQRKNTTRRAGDFF